MEPFCHQKWNHFPTNNANDLSNRDVSQFLRNWLILKILTHATIYRAIAFCSSRIRENSELSLLIIIS